MNVPKVSEPTGKICFVIAPIGDPGSQTRIRSDKVLKHIIAPAAHQCGYTTLRADEISQPGIITSQVIQHIIEDPLVIADLTGSNANVFYELAIRHAVRLPIVQLIDSAESIPFDVAATRIISFDYRDLDSAELAREQIARQIKAVETNPKDVDNPLTVAVELQTLRKSDNPLEKSAADIMSMLGDIMGMVSEIQRNTRKESAKAWTFTAAPGSGKTAWTTVSPVDVDALKAYMKYLGLEPTPPKPPKPEKGK